MKELLKPVVDELIGLVKSGKNLVREELPILAKEIIRYSIAENCLMVLFGVVVVVLTEYVRRRLMIFQVEAPLGQFNLGAGIISVCGNFFAMVVLLTSGDNLLKLVYAPKLFVIDYLRRWVK